MKHTAFLIWLIAACVIALPAKGLASYLIELKNGSKYVTSDYWEEGNQIKLKISGGEIGFSKDSVLRITETDLPVEAEIITPETPSTVAEPAPEAATPSVPGSEGEGAQEEVTAPSEPGPEAAAPSEPTPPEIDHEAYKARKRDILLQYRINDDRLNQALNSNDREAIKAAVADKKKTAAELNALNEELCNANNGVLPDWWHTVTE